MSDIAIAVREGADAVMLSGETAYGKFPFKAVEVMKTVAQRTESSMLRFSVSASDQVLYLLSSLPHDEYKMVVLHLYITSFMVKHPTKDQLSHCTSPLMLDCM